MVKLIPTLSLYHQFDPLKLAKMFKNYTLSINLVLTEWLN